VVIGAVTKMDDEIGHPRLARSWLVLHLTCATSPGPSTSHAHTTAQTFTATGRRHEWA
jgi:hypothetical protein